MIEGKKEFSGISQVLVKRSSITPLTSFFKKEINLKEFNKLAVNLINCEVM
ncbi:MAG: hypothetical protein ACP5GU_07125 [Thermoprotei archaeon]|jgi:hypothetical protein